MHVVKYCRSAAQFASAHASAKVLQSGWQTPFVKNRCCCNEYREVYDGPRQTGCATQLWRLGLKFYSCFLDTFLISQHFSQNRTRMNPFYSHRCFKKIDHFTCTCSRKHVSSLRRASTGEQRLPLPFRFSSLCFLVCFQKNP